MHTDIGTRVCTEEMLSYSDYCISTLHFTIVLMCTLIISNVTPDGLFSIHYVFFPPVSHFRLYRYPNTFDEFSLFHSCPFSSLLLFNSSVFFFFLAFANNK